MQKYQENFSKVRTIIFEEFILCIQIFLDTIEHLFPV